MTVQLPSQLVQRNRRVGDAGVGPIDHPKGALLRAQNVHRILGAGDTANHILRGVTLSVGSDEYVSIVGASGSGKSTLLYLLGGLDRPSRAGVDGAAFDPPSRVYIDGHDTSALGDAELALLRNEKVGFVFQFHYLLKEFTAAENVALPMLKSGKLGRSAAMDRAAMLLGQFGLRDKAKRRANRLSGGEQQRVAIARALANEPAVLLADEPTGNLDRSNSERVAEIFHELSAGGQAIVMVTHDVALANRARRIVTMEDGRIIADGPTVAWGDAVPVHSPSPGTQDEGRGVSILVGSKRRTAEGAESAKSAEKN